MKRILLALIAASFSATVAAEWVKVGETADATHFIDPDTLRKDGHLRKVWMLQNLKLESIQLSKRFRVEFDCKHEKARTLYFTTHVGIMAEGEMVREDNTPYDWIPVPPSTVAWTIMQSLCAK